MTTRPIEAYALLADGRSCALVDLSGSIDWLCWPRFDSPACFAALVGSPENGRWMLGPVEGARSTRRYRGDTLVLETDHVTSNGSVRVIDFMPTTGGAQSVVRMVVGHSGRVRMRHALALRFDHGRVAPWVVETDDGLLARLGPDVVRLRSTVRTANDMDGSFADFVVEAGETRHFVLSRQEAEQDIEGTGEPAALLEDTTRHWERLLETFCHDTPWPAAVRRSLLTLHALIDRGTGGMVAAPTTSLPEVPGGSSNWDYRYCWLRDASFTVVALLNAGMHREAIAWRGWLLRALGAEPAKLRIAYRVDGSTGLTEQCLDWLTGYGGARPVRVGNAAWDQHQVDVLGEVLDALNLLRKAGIEPTRQASHVEAKLVRQLEATWQAPGKGLWESRGKPRHYVYSKVMAWVGIDCFLKAADGPSIDPDERRRLERLRDTIHAEICERGYHRRSGTFVQHYGSAQLDASLLLLPLVGFLPAEDPRIARTVDQIERRLMVDGFVMRRQPKRGTPREGAFLACTCWLADCRLMQGRRDDAALLLERVLGVANDVGLLSEEYDVQEQRLVGNFPQALTHLAVLNSILGLSGPVLQRGGG